MPQQPSQQGSAPRVRVPGAAGVPAGGPAGWESAADALRAGQAAIFPTDTVYGLAVAPRFAPSPDVLYELKGRPSDKPVAWLVASVDDLDRYGADVPDWALQLARDHWPGALTLIVRASDNVPAAYRSAAGTIGLRMPDHAGALQLVRAVGCPLATTSANLSGQPSPQRFEDLAPELLARVPAVREPAEAVVADSNPDAPGAPVQAAAPSTPSGVASTVVDCTANAPNILRAGTIAELFAKFPR